MVPKLLIRFLFFSLVLLLCSPPIFALDQDYAQRETQASPAIKQSLQVLRDDILKRKLTYQVGYTRALDYRLDLLAGGRAPRELGQQLIQMKPVSDALLKIDQESMQHYMTQMKIRLPELQIACSATAGAWDWRKVGKVTHVRDQGGCGSCWAFAAIGAYESSYYIRNNSAADASEQSILNCSGAGACGGGWYTGALQYLINTGAGTEVAYPYTAHDAACQTAATGAFRAVVRGAVHPEVAIPSVAQIKEALCQYGPLAIGVLATPAFQAYASGVFNQGSFPLIVTGSDGRQYYNVNHCVTLIGWDDSKQAWLIKNSWGTGWGETGGFGRERGYIWVHYGSNNVGLFPEWVKARSNFYMVDISKYQQFYPHIKPFPAPIQSDMMRKR
jgi:cathepsin L